MIKNDIVSLLKSSSPIDHPILKTFVSFISLCASFEAGLIYSLGTLTLTDIVHVSIRNLVSPAHPKEVESPAKVTQNMLAYMGIEPHQISILTV